MWGAFSSFWVQATLKPPTTRNIRKALGLQFTVGTFPILLLTFVGYWAYGNAVSPYMLNSASGPKAAVIVANIAAFLQAIVSLYVSFRLQRSLTIKIISIECQQGNEQITFRKTICKIQIQEFM